MLAEVSSLRPTTTNRHPPTKSRIATWTGNQDPLTHHLAGDDDRVDREIEAAYRLWAVSRWMVRDWFANEFISLLPGGPAGGLALAGIYGSVLTGVWQLTKTRVKASARYLGGFLLALGLVLWALFIVVAAANAELSFEAPWVLRGSGYWIPTFGWSLCCAA